jgi:(1->4)-alpha-D-glucan 1-alpha-D-glucosylmutase
LWDLSLVDPDNRRPVDFDLRRQLLAEATTLTAEDIWQRRDTGLPKLWLIRKALAVRKRHHELFDGSSGSSAGTLRGPRAANVVALLRGGGVIAVVPRFSLEVKDDWGDTRLDIPAGSWRNELTGEDVLGPDIPVAQLLRKFPVALLARKEEV